MALAPADTFHPPRQAIGGFLLVLLGLFAIGVVGGVYVNIAALTAQPSALPLVIVNFVVVLWLGYAFVLGLTRDPRFPVNARDILIVTNVQLIVFFVSYFNLLSIAFNFLWIAYLQRSERVRVTYRPESATHPAAGVGVFDWVRANLLNSPFNVVLTVLAVDLIALTVPTVIRWALIDAIWSAPNGPACRGAGACWAFIAEKIRFIIFGFFPSGELWRPIAVVALFLLMILAACDRRSRGGRLVALWVAGLIAVYLLMYGGFAGMSTVETRLWSGLPLTLIIAVVGMVFAFPLAILLALGRRSRLPAVRAICVGYIELVRGVPLITVLFMASAMLPLFLPANVTIPLVFDLGPDHWDLSITFSNDIDKLLRAQVAFILFAAAYLAEVVRGGLQAIPRGQVEAAEALGLNYFQRTRLIVLPQALALVIPPLVNTFIGIFKDTTLVIIISLADLLGTAELALSDVNWQGFYIEDYAVIALIYFSFCFFMSRYSQMLEREFNRGARR